MPGAVVALARRYMTPADPHPRASTPTTTATRSRPSSSSSTARTRWTRSRCSPASCRPSGRGLTIIFCRTKRTAAKVADDLAERGFAAGAIHGDLGQGAREQALRAFRNGKVDVLVATDVAARGIDVEDVTHVINYQCPEDEKTYLHRIGRTAPRRRHRHRGHLRRLGRHAPLGADQQGARPGHPGAGGDLLHLRRTSTPTSTSPRAPRAACRRRSSTRAGLGAEELEDLGETGKGAGRRGPSSGGGDRGGRGGHSGDSRGGRGGESRGDSSRPASRDGDATPEGADRPRRNRNRRRTRGGSPSSDTTS